MPSFVNFVPVILYLFLAIWVAFVFRQLRKKRMEGNADLRQLALIIPFRNEENRLKAILDSLSFVPKEIEILFVDDHSEDRSLELLQAMHCDQAKIIQNEGLGKKAAIRTGVLKTDRRYILTMDADGSFGSNYFDVLKNRTWQEINILPVSMKYGSKRTAFFAWEYQLQQRLFTAFGWSVHPITGSGANLLFERQLFLDLEKERMDYHLASGDDHFFIQAAVRAKKSWQYLYHADLTVKTANVDTVEEGFNQRLRWMQKTNFKNDRTAYVFGGYLSLLQVGMYVSMGGLFASGHPFYALGVFLLKMDLDGHLTSFRYMKDFETWEVALYELSYPFYAVRLLLLGFVRRPKWKGRETKKAPGRAF